MPSKITFTKKEEAALQDLCDKNIILEMKHIDAVKGLLAKMEKAKNKPKGFSGIGVSVLITKAAVVLKDRLKMPEVTTNEWYIKMQRAINSGGITEEVADKAIVYVDKNWGDSIWIETLIYSMAKIAAGGMMSSGKSSKRTGFTPTKKSGWLQQLESED